MKKSTRIQTIKDALGGRSIVFVGMMGSGKSAIGRLLANETGLPYFDSDSEIAAAADMSIPEIFARDGEAFFRDRESLVLSRLLEGRSGVISTGGGAWIQPQNQALIRAAGLSLWLDADLETLWQRVRQRPTRPLLLTEDPRGTLARLIEQRSPVYARADLHLKSDSASDVETTARRAIELIRSARPRFLEER